MLPKNSDHRSCRVSLAWPAPTRPFIPLLNFTCIRTSGGIFRARPAAWPAHLAAVRAAPRPAVAGVRSARFGDRAEVGVTDRGLPGLVAPRDAVVPAARRVPVPVGSPAAPPLGPAWLLLVLRRS